MFLRLVLLVLLSWIAGSSGGVGLAYLGVPVVARDPHRTKELLFVSSSFSPGRGKASPKRCLPGHARKHAGYAVAGAGSAGGRRCHWRGNRDRGEFGAPPYPARSISEGSDGLTLGITSWRPRCESRPLASSRFENSVIRRAGESKIFLLIRLGNVSGSSVATVAEPRRRVHPVGVCLRRGCVSSPVFGAPFAEVNTATVPSRRFWYVKGLIRAFAAGATVIHSRNRP